MKKALMAGAAVAIVSAAPTFADGDLLATVDLYKDIYVDAYFTTYNTIDIDVDVWLDADKAAESIALINQRNQYNNDYAYESSRTDTIYDSGNYNTGGISINQATGNSNNQGTAVSIAIDDNRHYDDGEYGYASATGTLEQVNYWNDVRSFNTARAAAIELSLNYNEGIVHANQATGSFANQGNILSIALSDAYDGGVALAEADLGQFNTYNTVREADRDYCDCYGQVDRSASLYGSLNGNTGIFGVNQSAGNMSNQANVVSISAVGDF